MINKAVFNQSHFQMSIYYKCTPYGLNLFVLSHVYDCVYWYTQEELGKWFVDKIGKIIHVNLLEYKNWFIYNRISQLKEYSILVDQARYATSVVSKNLDTATIKENQKFTRLICVMI